MPPAPIKRYFLAFVLFFSFSLIPLNSFANTSNALDNKIQNQNLKYTIQHINNSVLTVKQYADFLNAVAWQSDIHALYSFSDNFNQNQIPIIRTVNSDNTYHYLVIPGMEEFAMTGISLNSAKRYCNWSLNGSQPLDESTSPDDVTENGAYFFTQSLDGEEIVEVNPNTSYYISNEDESDEKTTDTWLNSNSFLPFYINIVSEEVFSSQDTLPLFNKGALNPPPNTSIFHLTPKDKLLLKGAIVTGEFLLLSAACFMVGELILDYFIFQMEREAILKAFPVGRFVVDAVHIIVNSFLEGGEMSVASSFLEAVLTAGIHFSESSACFVVGEVFYDIFISKMGTKAILETFPLGRIITKVVHIVFNSFLAGEAAGDDAE